MNNDINLLNDILNELHIDSVIKYGMTALHFAVKNHNIQIINFLLSRGADANVCDENGISPLHLAAADGNLEIASILLNARANINQID
jgi:ankyrin repeat protein